jgi:hypothetical protein
MKNRMQQKLRKVQKNIIIITAAADNVSRRKKLFLIIKFLQSQIFVALQVIFRKYGEKSDGGKGKRG